MTKLPPAPVPVVPPVPDAVGGGGGSHTPFLHWAPLGQIAPWHASMHAPPLQTVPVEQVMVSQPRSTHWPLSAPPITQTWPLGQARHPHGLTHAPRSHTPPGHDTPAQGSTHTPSWHTCPSGQTTPWQPPTQVPP